MLYTCYSKGIFYIGLAFLLSSSLSLPVKLTDSKSNVIIKRSVAADSRRAVPSTAHPVIEGHNIELQCKANGPTPPIIHWLFNGVHVEQGPYDHLAANLVAPTNPDDEVESDETEIRFEHDYFTISTLRIKNAGSQHAGRYTCVADLPGERKSKNYVVTVTAAEPTDLQPSKRSGSSAVVRVDDTDTRIYLYTEAVLEKEGVSTLLICRATQGRNKTAPTITWTINGTTVTNQTAGYQILNTGDLKILHTTVAEHHMAVIKCRADGEGGKFDEKEPFVYLLES